MSPSRVTEWVAALDSDPVAATEAVERLEAAGSAALPTLCAALDVGNPLVRWRALRVLGRIGDPNAATFVRHRLEDGDERVRVEAGRALAQLGGDLAVQCLARLALRKELSMGSIYVAYVLSTGLAPGFSLLLLRELLSWHTPACQLAVVTRLGVPGNSGAIPALSRALRKGTPDVRIGAAAALGRIGDPRGVAPLCCVTVDEPGELLAVREQALVRIGALAVPELARLATQGRGSGPHARLARSHLLRHGKRALLTLTAILDRGDPLQHEGAASLLGEIGTPECVPALVDALESPDPGVRAAAIWALTRCGPGRSHVLRSMLQDPKPQVRARAALGLLELGAAEDELMGLLPAALQSRETAVCRAALGVVERLVREHPSPVLRELLPVLRSMLRVWSNLPLGSRQRVETLIREVEAATGAVCGLPVPASGAAPAPEGLPVPAQEVHRAEA